MASYMCTSLTISVSVLVVYIARYIFNFSVDLQRILETRRIFETGWMATYASMKPITLSSDQLAEYDKRGYLVVRSALPRSLVLDLYALVMAYHRLVAAESEEIFNDEVGNWMVHHQSLWMDLDDLADFVFHPTSPLGSIAAQLLRADTIRFGAESFKGTARETNGSAIHIDVGYISMRPRQILFRSPRDTPLTRLFIPLSSSDIIANETGGSLFLLPLDTYASLAAQSASACNQKRSLSAEQHFACLREMESLFPSALDLALGDLIFYSPVVAHKTQPMIRGHRIGYTADFYDPHMMREYFKTKFRPYCFLHPPGFCDADKLKPLTMKLKYWKRAHCHDTTRNALHYTWYWQSEDTAGVSEHGSACFPQVYPHTLTHEVDARRLGHVQNWRKKDSLPSLLESYFPVSSIERIIDAFNIGQ